MNWKTAITAGILALFVVTVAILLRLMPGPHKAADYLVIGTLATCVCILIAFIAFISTSGKRSEIFFKRKR